MKILQYKRPPGQLGGFAKQEMIYGSHTIRTFASLADHAGLSSGLLFIDLRNAFHRLPRELITGFDSQQDDFAAVLRALEAADFNTEGLRAQASQPALLARLQAHPILHSLLCDLHRDTWYVLKHNRRIIRTREEPDLVRR